METAAVCCSAEPLYRDFAARFLPASKIDPFRLVSNSVVPRIEALECPYALPPKQTIVRFLGRWNSDCYRRYIDHSAADRRAMVAAALFSTRDGPLVPSTPAWRDPVI